jgi:hypothetical protein
MSPTESAEGAQDAMVQDQTVTISARATAFTVVCDLCTVAERGDAAVVPTWVGASFAGNLDLDLDRGVFLCRRGHTVRVVRARHVVRSSSTAAA